MQITVISISSPEYKSKGKNKWQEITLAYKSDRGDKEKKFPSYVDIYETIKGLEVGSTYEVRLQKDGDYWQWVAVEKVEGAPKAAGGKSSAGGTDWAAKTQLDRERFEFEKEKQILIIRQSMIAAAISYLWNEASDTATVIRHADEFVDYVLNGRAEIQSEEEPDIE